MAIEVMPFQGYNYVYVMMTSIGLFTLYTNIIIMLWPSKGKKLAV